MLKIYNFFLFRCLYSNPPPPPPPPPICTRLPHLPHLSQTLPHLPQTCSDGHLDMHLSLQRRHSERRPPTAKQCSPKHLPNDGLVVLKVVSSASAEPDKKTQYELVKVSERHGRFRKAVPCMPLALSILLCIVNMLAPGVGKSVQHVLLSRLTFFDILTLILNLC